MNSALLEGITLGLLLSIAVGPVLFSIIKQSLNNGVKGGLAFVLGVSLSDISLALAANLFTELFRALDTRRAEIGIVGSTFLISVGIYFLFFKKVRLNPEGAPLVSFRKRDYVKTFLAGLLMNTLSPTIILFWLTASAAFVKYSPQSRITIFSIALALVLTSDLLKVFLANRIRQRLTPRNILAINRLNGLILIGFGLALLAGLLLYPSTTS